MGMVLNKDGVDCKQYQRKRTKSYADGLEKFLNKQKGVRKKNRR